MFIFIVLRFIFILSLNFICSISVSDVINLMSSWSHTMKPRVTIYHDATLGIIFICVTCDLYTMVFWIFYLTLLVTFRNIPLHLYTMSQQLETMSKNDIMYDGVRRAVVNGHDSTTTVKAYVTTKPSADSQVNRVRGQSLSRRVVHRMWWPLAYPQGMTIP